MNRQPCDFGYFCDCAICNRATRRFVWRENRKCMTEHELKAEKIGITADQYSLLFDAENCESPK